jgi:hypothetical protein
MKEPMEFVHPQGAADESGADRRGRRRQRVLKKALIVFNNSHSTMGCQILDTSDTGARLMPVDMVGCPREFLLKLHDAEARPCEVIWRRGTQIGVRYLETERQPDPREQRKQPRRQTLQKAVIGFNNNHSSMGCQILDISDRGARLIPADIYLCPRNFVLNPQNGAPRRCEIVWRQGTQIGVRYL